MLETLVSTDPTATTSWPIRCSMVFWSSLISTAPSGVEEQPAKNTSNKQNGVATENFLITASLLSTKPDVDITSKIKHIAILKRIYKPFPLFVANQFGITGV